ncbi:MAG: acyl-CoA synthetase [Pseudomonadota bacterium]
MSITSLADIEEFEQTPSRQRWRGDNAYDLIQKAATTYAERPALKFQFTAALDEDPLVVTYRQLLARVTQTANALHAAGVSIGGVTSILLPNVAENHFALWGTQALGIAGPINYMLESVALRDIMTESDAEALIVLGPTVDFDIWEKTLAIVDDVPTLKVVLQVNSLGTAQPSPGQTPGGVPIIDFTAALNAQPADKLVFERDIDPEDIGVYFHTGGTTGTPKIAQISHRNQMHVAGLKADYSDLTENSVGIGGLPLFHVNAVYNTGLNFFASGGHAVFLTPLGFRTRGLLDNFWPLVAKYRGTMFNTVPTVVSALLSRPLDGIDISSLEYVSCGAAPISAAVFKQFQDYTGANIIEGYGLTEGTLASSSNPLHGEKRLGSIGMRYPYQQMKCVILDDDNRYVRDCETDEVGVIVIKGPNVFQGYKQQAANEGAFFDGWFITGDLAREDADGYFYMVGRAKDLIIRGGNNIDPKGIEDTLTKHPAVMLAAAVGQPDAYAGELPCAFVTVSDDFSGDRDALAAELLAFAKQHVSERAAAPVHIELVDTMPLTAVGKIFKPALQMRAIERVLGAAVRDVEPASRIEVVKDERRGLVARISVPNAQNATSESQQAVRKALDQFAISYEFS